MVSCVFAVVVAAVKYKGGKSALIDCCLFLLPFPLKVSLVHLFSVVDVAPSCSDFLTRCFAFF
jgi:hypothetical protein